MDPMDPQAQNGPQEDTMDATVETASTALPESETATGEPKPAAARATAAPDAAAVSPTRRQTVDVDYTLWLATLATALMAVICLIANGVLYIADMMQVFAGGAGGTSGATHIRLFELTALFSVAAGIAHFLRLRLQAMRRAALLVPLPFRVVANPPGGDLMSKFECSCAVTLHLEAPEPLENLKLKREALNQALDNAFVVAVTDPVIRYSKAKMEQTLRVAAHHVLGAGVSGVTITDIKQRRVPRKEAADATVGTAAARSAEDEISAPTC